MKIKFLSFCLLLLLPGLQTARSQKVYPVSRFEHIFQFAEIEQEGYNVTNKMRYTLVYNYGQYWHVDLNNNVGLYSGLALRNVGFIYDRTDALTGLNPQKIIRRSYALGVPLALKLGAFDKNIYLYGGGEYELMFLYKEKMWEANSRSGPKFRDTEWFSGKTKRFVPSVFAGIQLPGGINIRAKYYLDHFLNTNYVGTDLGVPNVRYDSFSKIQMFYVAVSWQFRTDQWKKDEWFETVAQQ